MSIYDKIHGQSQGDGSLNLTAKQFLGKDPNVKGVFNDSKSFLKYVSGLRRVEVDYLDQLFNHMQEGHRMTGALTTRVDKGNNPYQFPNFQRAKGTSGVKVVITPEMSHLLKSYIDGKIAINFTLEELYEEANNG